MNASTHAPVYWDPYHPDIWKDPYPTFRRLREEAPLYFNEEHGFYALSRFDDVRSGLLDSATFSSARGTILEIIKAEAELPPSLFIFQDPPVHTAYRSVMQRLITPKRMNSLESQIRDLCARSLDPHVGTGRFDFIANLGAEMPMRVIGMLLGIPEQDQKAVQEFADNALRAEAGKPITYDPDNFSGAGMAAFDEYIDWRTKHPSDDIITELIQTDFKDPTGTVRKLDRDEILAIVNMVAGAGNETTNRLIGWTGKILGEHHDQRRDLAQNPRLIPQAIEELLRYESPGAVAGRVTTRDTEYYDRKIPAGSIMMLIFGCANRDDRRFKDGDRFNIHREAPPHLAFGNGIHVCIGAALARLEGRVALEEVLKRFPDWEVDNDNAEMSATTTVRGWDSLPVFTSSARKTHSLASSPVVAATPETTQTFSIEGTWNLTVKGPTGPMPTELIIERKGDALTGIQSGQGMSEPISDLKFDGKNISWINHVKKPVKLKLECSGLIEGNAISGKMKAGFMGSYPFTGTKAP